MPEVRAGNATVNAAGARRWPPCRTRRAASDSGCRSTPMGGLTIAELCRPRWRAAGGALRPAAGSRALARLAGSAVRHRGGQGRRGLRREARLARRGRDRARDAPARRPAALAHRRPAARRRRVRARRGAPRPALGTGRDPRARPRPPRDLRRCAAAEADRRETRSRRGRGPAGAEVEPISEADWVARCAALPPARVRLAGRDARVALPGLDAAWVYDAGRRLALVPHETRPRGIAPQQSRSTTSRGARRARPRGTHAVSAARPRPGGERAARRADGHVRLVRPVPPGLPDVPPDAARRASRRAAASSSSPRCRPDELDPRGRAPAPRPLPRLPRLRAGLPVGRALRRDPRARARRRRRHAHAHRRRPARRRTPPGAGRRPRPRRPPARGAHPGPLGAMGRATDRPSTVIWERRRPGAPRAAVLRGCVMQHAFAPAQQAAVDALAALRLRRRRGPGPGLLRRPAPAQRRAVRGRPPARRDARGIRRRHADRVDLGGLRRGAARACSRARRRPHRGASPAHRSPPRSRGDRCGSRSSIRAICVTHRASWTSRAGSRPRSRARCSSCAMPAAVAALRGCTRSSSRRSRTQLRDDRVAAIRESGAEVVACGNPGCALQLRQGLAEAGLVAGPRRASRGARGRGP